ncbi:hypothetical protein, partial [Streptomyces viridochromogenes]|uniref:hypothetical protein n=1 Tax=Streptomyces viridochromogenes TaxID=1938 RepID=UPI001907D2F1
MVEESTPSPVVIDPAVSIPAVVDPSASVQVVFDTAASGADALVPETVVPVPLLPDVDSVIPALDPAQAELVTLLDQEGAQDYFQEAVARGEDLDTVLAGLRQHL